MKYEPYGYPVDSGYIGFINGKKMLFETEGAYEEVIFEMNEAEKGEE